MTYGKYAFTYLREWLIMYIVLLHCMPKIFFLNIKIYVQFSLSQLCGDETVFPVENNWFAVMILERDASFGLEHKYKPCWSHTLIRQRCVFTVTWKDILDDGLWRQPNEFHTRLSDHKKCSLLTFICVLSRQWLQGNTYFITPLASWQVHASWRIL